MSGYPEVLKYFMWSWQVHFRISCQTAAESLFNQLDRGLRPSVFLIGFLEEKRNDRLPICIEPEEYHYSIEEFENIQSIADNLYTNDENRKMIYTGPGVQEEMDKRLKVNSFRVAIEKILNESGNNPGNICFVSSPAKIDGFQVYLVLELNQSIYESHIHLKKVDIEERMKIYYSLLETTKDAYLKDRLLNMYLPEPGKNLSADSRSSEELIRDAGKSFMYTIAWAGKYGMGIHGLFESCNKLSTLKYEGIENYGKLIIASKEHPSVEMSLEINEPFNIRDYRKVRKFLQLSGGEIGVICNSYEVFGLGKIKSTYNPETESIFEINFKGVHCWDVVHNGVILMQMRYGQPGFETESINKNKFFSDTKRIFKQISSDKIDLLYNLSLAATLQKKGALLIYSEQAKREANRLKSQCIGIKPVKLNEEIVLKLSNVDGGVLIDTDGYAHANGVILDGIVNIKGDSARGSRYNSAITYYENFGKNIPTIIVIVSEDGMVNIIPNLMPQIRHSEIIQVIKILEGLNSAENFDRGTFYQAMEWLKNRAFYLTNSECVIINKLKIELESLDEKSGHTMWVKHDNLEPNLDMNESYYYEE